MMSSSEKSSHSPTPQSMEKLKVTTDKIKDSDGKDPTSAKVKAKLAGSLSLKRKLDDKRYR